MFFGHKEEKQVSFFPFFIFRLLLSLSMFFLLIFGAYQAFKYFSGVDPVSTDPHSLIFSLVGSDQAATLLTAILELKIPTNLSEAQELWSSEASPRLNGLTSNSRPQPSGKIILRFALVADSHNDQQNLSRALELTRSQGAKFVIGLGDYTEVGTLEELAGAKEVFEGSGLPYYLTAGDHDLWNARDQGVDPVKHFTQVFGSPYQSFGDSNIRFIIVYNSDNYRGVDDLQLEWLKGELSRLPSLSPVTTLVFMHEPLYHPSSDHFMGKVRQDFLSQAGYIRELLSEAKVSGVFYGDTHYFTEYQDPKTSLWMTAVGALTKERNAQRPRFGIVDVYEDGNVKIQDVEI